jgi:hypothetical protein
VSKSAPILKSAPDLKLVHFFDTAKKAKSGEPISRRIKIAKT